ncbi:hypothetical protein HMPREF9103_02516 [Lentilactobacillus parafarraginis F0439]|uniref:Uncharacterized protein n=1 Tax=Lentilactobacillus parafarraginis F0439 TaxID=797515 RepID=G9ZRZ9_9LACO|nr:hypothetical protein HMPREF9103_02516 [Lentilactobacillus parafarraginis F0439]
MLSPGPPIFNDHDSSQLSPNNRVTQLSNSNILIKLSYLTLIVNGAVKEPVLTAHKKTPPINLSGAH